MKLSLLTSAVVAAVDVAAQTAASLSHLPLAAEEWPGLATAWKEEQGATKAISTSTQHRLATVMKMWAAVAQDTDRRTRS